MKTMSHREKICMACSSKRCCSYYVVHMTGLDVCRIAGALQLFPADFVAYHESQTDGEELFLLSPDGPRYALTLAKRDLPDASGPPCLFLLQTNDGHARCGLHDLRPLQCQIYPVFVEDNAVALINDPSGCVRTWSYGDIDVEEEQKRTEWLKALETEHIGFVREWNRRVVDENATRCFEDFCAYLLNCCGARGEAP